MTAGSVDDGKSTLIGRLLAELGAVPADELAALPPDASGNPDYALLLDGLEAEREQGITVDVAYRYFASDARSFILADVPGHEQYTRNMACAASVSDAAILLVDARKGVLTQTRRHAHVASLLGVRHLVLAVNKMDLTDWREDAFRAAERSFADFAAPLGFATLATVPVSALTGAGLARPASEAPWHRGPTLLEALEALEPEGEGPRPLRFPVQRVERTDERRMLLGTIASGVARVGDAIVVLPAGARARIAAIDTTDGPAREAAAGEAVGIALDTHVDAARGDLIACAGDPPALADRLCARLVWLGREPLLPRRDHLMRIGTRWLTARVTHIQHRFTTDTLEPRAARTLDMNEVGLVHLMTAEPVAFDPYEANPATGAFILVDRDTGDTLAAGTVVAAIERNIRPHAHLVGRAEREALQGHRSFCVWLTGLSGSGKSTIANLLDQRLHARGVGTFLLDGDNLRWGLNRDLGFTDADRVENIRRAGEVARLFVEAGLVTIVSFISPFATDRALVRALFGEGDFVEVFVDTPLETCIARDPKGLYARALRGEIPNFTGITSPYERPETPDLRLDGAVHDPQAEAARLAAHLESLLRRG